MTVAVKDTGELAPVTHFTAVYLCQLLMTLSLHNSRPSPQQGHRPPKDTKLLILTGADFLYAGIWGASQACQRHSNKPS